MSLDKLHDFTNKISDLPNKPNESGMSATELKAYFDSSPEEIRIWANKLIDSLQSTTYGDSGAKNIGVTSIDGLTGNDVQALLETLKEKIDHSDTNISNLQNTKSNKADVLEKINTTPFTPTAEYQPATKKYVDDTVTGVTLGQVPDGSITDAKLSNATGQIKQVVVSHLADSTSHVHYAVAAGAANNYVATIIPAPSAYVEGLALAVKINVSNTGASTINVNGLGARNILKSNGNALTSGNLRANSVYTLRYNGTAFILQGEGGEYGTATASDVLAGKTIGTENGIVTGTMPYNGARNGTITTQGGQIAIPAGYTTGGTISANFANLTPANVRQGVNIGGLVGTVQEGLPMIAGSTMVYSSSRTGGATGQTYSLALEFTINVTGTYNVRFSLSADSSGIVYGRIYKNDVAYGTERSTTNTAWTSFSQNLSFAKGDRLGIYLRRGVGVLGGWCGEFSLNIDASGLATPT